MQCVFQKNKFCFQVCYLIDFVNMKHTAYNFLDNETNFFIFFKEISFYKSEFIQIISIIKSETPTLRPHLPKSYVSQASCTIQLDLHPFPSLFAHCFSNFSGSHFKFIMVSSQRLRIDTCYFYLGKLIHFEIKMPLPIGDLLWYFSKWQLAYLEYLRDIEWSRIYFQISPFFGFNETHVEKHVLY